MPKIEQWYVAWTDSNPYLPPEQRGKSIIGLVYGSAKFPDGEQIKTGPVKAVDGRKITTMSDETYELGEPEPGYLAFLEHSGIKYDEVEPMKLVKHLEHGNLEGKRPLGGGRK